MTDPPAQPEVPHSDAPLARRSIANPLFARYLLIGAANTIFGYGCFAAFTALLSGVIPHSYIVANVIASIINITVSYLNYKFFVFQTKGNYVREWLRSIAVYSGGIVISTALLPVLVLAIRRATSFDAAAPYLAGAILIACTTLYSFVGHQRFTFRTSAR